MSERGGCQNLKTFCTPPSPLAKYSFQIVAYLTSKAFFSEITLTLLGKFLSLIEISLFTSN